MFLILESKQKDFEKHDIQLWKWGTPLGNRVPILGDQR